MIRTIMPFGKYRGHRVCDLPAGYLLWLIGNCSRMDPGLHLDIRAELKTRGYRDAAEEMREELRKRAEPAPGLNDDLIRRWHRELVMRWHPDRGGSHEAMQAVNDAHKRLREMLQEQGAN